MGITKERLKDMATGAVVGAVATTAVIAVSGVGKRIAKEAFKSGANMVGFRAGYGNITGYIDGEAIQSFDSSEQFESYVDDLYEEYLNW